MIVKRFDFTELKKPVRHDSGFLRVDSYLTRTGIFEYRDPSGKIRREYRPAEEVFHKDSLESFAQVPVTDDHPPEMVSPDNVDQYIVGAVGEGVHADGEFVRATLAIHKGGTIKAIESGDRQELSCGYSCEIDETPGTFGGEKYDCVQRKIRGNHVALVKKGRAGPEVRVRLDANDAVQVGGVPPKTNNGDNRPMKKIRVDGVEYEGTEQLEQAITLAFNKRDAAANEFKAKADSLNTELEKTKAKLDSVVAELKEASNPEKLQSAIRARVALETAVTPVLGKETKLDTMSEKDIKLAVLAKVRPEAKFDGKPDAYIDGAFEMAMEKATASGTVADVRSQVVTAGRSDSQEVSAAAARAKMVERLNDAWKQTSK